jgi:transglutaminase-like putative cysteine protease
VKLKPGPKAPPYQKAWEAYLLVDRVERWTRVFKLKKRVNAPRESAYERVASERGWDRDTVVKYYNRAKSTLRLPSSLWLGGQN